MYKAKETIRITQKSQLTYNNLLEYVQKYFNIISFYNKIEILFLF